MRSFQGLKVGAAIVLLAGTLLGGCVVAPAPGYYGGVVAVAPPPPQVEVIGVAPTPGYVWIGGYWNWVGGRHVWGARLLGCGPCWLSLGSPSLGSTGVAVGACLGGTGLVEADVMI